MTIQTNRLTLRAIQPADAQNISRYGGDYGVASMCSRVPSPYPRLAAEGWIMILKQDRSGDEVYAITLNDRPDLIGMIGIHNLDDPFIGYWIGRPFWGRGLATEACAGLIESFKSRHDHKGLRADYYLDNPASGRVLEKLGFQTEGDPVSLFSLARGVSAPGQTVRLNFR